MTGQVMNISSMTRRISELEKENAELKAKATGVHVRISTAHLDKRITDLSAEVVRLSRLLETVEMGGGSKAQVLKMSQRIQHQRRELRAANASIVHLWTKVEGKVQHVGELRAKLAITEKALENANARADYPLFTVTTHPAYGNPSYVIGAAPKKVREPKWWQFWKRI